MSARDRAVPALLDELVRIGAGHLHPSERTRWAQCRARQLQSYHERRSRAAFPAAQWTSEDALDRMWELACARPGHVR